jgi:hypothetical protein
MAMDQEAVSNTSVEPKPTEDVGKFKIKVLLNGTVQGWWADAGGVDNWITVVDKEGDASVWYWVPSSGATYLAAGTNNYLSYRTGGAYAEGLKMRGWVYAGKWQKEGQQLKSGDNGKLVGMDGKSFYANGQNVVELEYV